MWGKHLILQLEITEKFCYYPPPTESRRLMEITETFCHYPPPIESGRLLETEEKTQEIQQAQLGSSAHSLSSERRRGPVVGHSLWTRPARVQSPWEARIIRCKNLALYIRDCESLYLSDETVKAVGPFYLVSMPGEVKDPTQGVNV